MKKVLILTYYWPPSGGPGVQRWLKFVKYLPQLGYEPIVITVDPAKATYPITDESLLKEVPEGLTVIRTSTREPYGLYKKLSGRKQVPYSGFTNEVSGGFFSKISRFIRGNLFVPDARIGWNSFAIKKAAEVIKNQKIEVFITTSPPHSTQLAGLELKKMFPEIRWIADLRDPWTDIFYYNKMLHLPYIKKRDQEFEKNVLRNADSVITVSDFISRIFSEKPGSDCKGKVHVITNGYDPDDFLKTDVKRDPEFFTLAYVGTISDEYLLSGLVNACEKAREKLGNKFRVMFTGNISSRWKEPLENKLGNSVFFSGHVDHHEAVKRMQMADMLLLVIPEIEHNEGIITGKLFEYLAASRPVLGIGPLNGDAARVLEKTAAGKMFSYNDHKNISAFILQYALKEKEWLPDQDQINKFSRKAQTEKLVQLMESNRK
ncbi:MAG: glycosyltransferase family 4 protein [Bacteroidales bacterium]|nr:glycosyltransferase family 4 protein [Bacteroidales bacterium]